MDLLASLAFGIVVINAIKRQGFSDKKDIAKATLKAGIFAMTLMMLIYGPITLYGTVRLSMPSEHLKMVDKFSQP